MARASFGGLNASTRDAPSWGAGYSIAVDAYRPGLML